MTTYLTFFLTSMIFIGFTLIFPVLKEIREEEKDILAERINLFLTFCRKKWLVSKSENIEILTEDFKKHSISVWCSYKQEHFFRDLTKQQIALKNDPDRLGQIKNLNTALYAGLALYVLLVIFTFVSVTHYGQNTPMERLLMYENAILISLWYLTLFLGIYNFGIMNKILDKIQPTRKLPKSN